MSEPLEGFSTATEPPAAGRLLVASIELVDPSFASSVVLLLDHDEDGTLGVVINRPTPVVVSTVLPDWGEVVDTPEVLFSGGPVSTDAALAVASLPPTAAEDPVGFRRLFGTTGIIDLDTPAEVLSPAVAHLRVFAGYAGWSPGQLDAEIAEGSWYVVESRSSDIFTVEPAALRLQVLRRQPGELAWVSTRPDDPHLN